MFRSRNKSIIQPQLLHIFPPVTERQLWQEMTGRLLQTKTASLYMQGSQRFMARSVDILNVDPGEL